MFGHTVIMAAKEHAERDYPRETIGLVVEGTYLPLENISKEATKEFQCDSGPGSVWFQNFTTGRVSAVIHSHPAVDADFNYENGFRPGGYPECPSAEDMQAQIDTAVPWGIIVVREGRAAEPFWFGDQLPMPPLIGRTFRHGVTDCYSIVRDWYRLERGIVLPVGPRDWNWWAAEQQNPDFYMQGYKEHGFERLGENVMPMPGDVLLAQVGLGVKVANHAAVYLGNGLMLHHMVSRLSKRDPVSLYKKHIYAHMRYVGNAADSAPPRIAE